jgi:hypothetical protein
MENVSTPIFRRRPLRVCYLPSHPKVVDPETVFIEDSLKRLGDIKLVKIRALDDPAFKPCDLLILGATHVAGEDFATWLKGIEKRVMAEGAVWTPALIIADPPWSTLSRLLGEVVATNWYFDVVSFEHVTSLPVRVANLLRIHDHLHELHRYEAAVRDLERRTAKAEAEVDALRSQS